MKKYDGVAIAVAWPQFVGKQTGSWYDTPMRWLGINRDFHYKVGHAALILVNCHTGICHHLDCGRYHAPFQYGRVRDASTDFDVSIRAKAIFKEGKIINIGDILKELQTNLSFHGEGPLYGAYCPVNFENVWSKAKSMQSRGIIPFGPFTINGTNCCRFVRACILAGNPAIKYQLMLRYLWNLRPMPITNVNILSNKIIIPNIADIDRKQETNIKQESFTTTSMYTKNLYDKGNVNGTLPAPHMPKNIPSGSQWLSGEVAGSWFDLKPLNKSYIISRYSPQGTLECTGKFNLIGNINFSSNKPYQFTFLSHCDKVSIIQDNKMFEFYRESAELTAPSSINYPNDKSSASP